MDESGWNIINNEFTIAIKNNFCWLVVLLDITNDIQFLTLADLDATMPVSSGLN